MFRKHFLLVFILLGLTNANGFAQNTLVFQPNGNCSHEAIVWYLSYQNGKFGPTNSQNISQNTYLAIQEWTWHGSQGHRWVLLDFLKDIDLPENLDITAARLSLYVPDKATSDGFHSLYTERRKRSIAVIERILEPWEENLVSWDSRPAASRLNQVILPEPMSEQDDYIDIDVTNLVRDMIQMPDQSHGFLIRMQDDDYYRKLIFASSNISNAALRPRLEIDYIGEPLSLIKMKGCSPRHECAIRFSDTFEQQFSGAMVYRPSIAPACPVTNYHFRVYDLEGHELFYTTKPQMGWNGKYQGKGLTSGQYLYFCSYQLPGEDVFTTQSGVFRLVREIKP